MKLVAWTLIKANSSRVPGKNFRLLGGRPLFSWILDTLSDLPEVEQVIVNTDARSELVRHGFVESERVVLRDRRPDLLGDDVTANQLLSADLPDLPGDVVLMTHVTNPF